MKKDFSPAWISSKQRRKQRKYRANAPLHLKRKFVSANLAKALREKHHKRSLPLRKGDSVKIMRGAYKGKTGKIVEVDIKRSRVFVSGIDFIKKDGSKVRVPLSPSNLQITSLVLDDDRRLGKSEVKEGQKAGQSAKKGRKEEMQQGSFDKINKPSINSSKTKKNKETLDSKSGFKSKERKGKKTKKTSSGSKSGKGSKDISRKSKTEKHSTKNSEASD